ncbi:aryl-alcohol oxidase precursor [Armillaria luteobubalina]|uniref:Aryl-alcohol oxidase n=1 Tax=Armillaria luteobubalina TaxID=153913 RepID=A0AA39Q3S7_9AGAR|nr:aryl-alcohol oxidase precursor [Armillaria luteobubalina]
MKDCCNHQKCKSKSNILFTRFRRLLPACSLTRNTSLVVKLLCQLVVLGNFAMPEASRNTTRRLGTNSYGFDRWVMNFLLLSLLTLYTANTFGAIYETLEELPTLDFDFIIIGGGTAGNVVANRLTEDPNISVPFFCPQITPGTPWDWNFTTTEQPGLNGRSIPLPRGYGLGGSSAVNYMAYTRGSSQDYDRYAKISGDPGWGWEALQPYFRKNERFVAPADHHNTSGQFDPAVHGFDGINFVSLPGYPRGIDGRVIQVTKELPREFPFNLDYNSGYELGIGWRPSTIGNGTRSSSQTSYLGLEYVGRPNLHVLIHAHVTRILPSSDTPNPSVFPTFNAVEFSQDDGATMHILAPPILKEIILSAGAIGSPHILLNSGIGDRTELSALGIQPVLHLPDVGKNLTDHPSYVFTFFVNNTDTIENIYFRNATFQMAALAEWQTNRTGFLSTGAANQGVFLRVPHDSGIIEREPCAGDETAHYELIFSNGLLRGPIPDTGNYLSVTAAALCPLSRGNVTIGSANPLESPLINPNYLFHKQDLATLQYAITSAHKFVTSPAWEGYILGLATNTTIRDGVRSLDHSFGTASMSPPDADWGVVDPDLKLKGAKGVRIVDASIFPFLPAAHPQVAVYVMAERTADIIRIG